MKTQLLMIIAVVLSSLLTALQHANAQEIDQLRWLEPSVEQRFSEVVVSDQELGSDNNCISSAYFVRKPSIFVSSHFSSYHYFPYAIKVSGNASPRAPPALLI